METATTNTAISPVATFFSGVLLLLTSLLLFKHLVGTRRYHPNLPPRGPIPLPIIGHLHHLGQPLHLALSRIAARHGPLLLLRFGSRPTLVVTSPSLAQECFTKNDLVFANRPVTDSGRLLTYDYTTVTSAPYGPLWRNLRRVTATEIFSPARAAALSSFLAEAARSTLKQLYKDVGDGFQRVVLKPKLSELTMNFMMQMIAGKQYSSEIAAAADPDESKRFMRIVEEVMYLAGVFDPEDLLPSLRRVMRVLKLKNGLRERHIRLEREMDALFQDIVDNRRRRSSSEEPMIGEENKSIVDVMLSLQETNPEYYTDDIIKGMILALLTGGTDGTGGAVEWAMSFLLNHGDALEKVIAEIQIEVGHDRLVKDSDLPRLHYLHNVMKETFRLKPTAPLLVPHESSADCMVGGYHVPKGTMLIVNIYAMNRDPEVWADPLLFRPERFERGDQVEGCGLTHFGCGRRRCPGEGLATRLVGLVLAGLIQCFDWKRIGEEEVDMGEAGALTLKKSVPLEALYRPREEMVDVLSKL